MGSALEKFLRDGHWKATIEPFLRSDACSQGIHVAGHSLGGALAALFSACANSGSNPYNFRVDYLWNFAGPGTSEAPLKNGQSLGGNFAGKRFWNEDGAF